MEFSDLSARERILATAHDLFYREGIRATGVDKLIARAGVTKVTFYRHFPSKDDLVRAFLQYRHERWMGWFIDALGRRGADAAAPDGSSLLLLADCLEEWCESPGGFRGCAFINTVVEMADALPDAVAISRAHKADMIGVIAQLLPESRRRQDLAECAAMAFDGAIVRAQMSAHKADFKNVAARLRSLLRALGSDANHQD